MYKIYSKDNCPWCVKAKDVMMNCGLEYEELQFGVDFTKYDLERLLPEGAPLTVPQIFVRDRRIGGYEALMEYLEQSGVLGTKQ